MGKIQDNLKDQIHEVMKKRDEARLSTLRMLSSALSYEEIAKQHNLSDDEEIEVVRKEAKKRTDAIESYEKVGAKDRAEKEKLELAILKEYLPAEMSDDDLEKIVEDTLKEIGVISVNDMGRVIGAVMGKVKGKADGKRVSIMVRQKLS